MKYLLIFVAVLGLNSFSIGQTKEATLSIKALSRKEVNTVTLLNFPKGSQSVLYASSMSLTKTGDSWIAIPSSSAKFGTIKVVVYEGKKVIYEKEFKLPIVD